MITEIIVLLFAPLQRFCETNWVRLGAGLAFSVAILGAQAPAGLPEGPGRATTQRICGACHSPTIVVGHNQTAEQWKDTVTNMVVRGAKGTPAELTEVTNYLTKSFPPNGAAPAAPGRAAPRPPRRFGAGPDDQQVVDAAAAERGKSLYSTDCATCHGPQARGTNNGPDLVRSVVVLHDRYGDTLGPFLKTNHPLSNDRHLPALSENQVKDLSHFLHQQMGNTLRTGPYTKVLNVLTGDAHAGAAYFNGPGGCNKCHSPTGDLAGIASKYDPATLQQRFLFPRAVGFGRRGIATTKPTNLTVTPANGAPVSGTLVHLDDFMVSLRDSSGHYHSWKRTPDLKVEKQDPYAAHDELLDKYTDRDIHNVVAYLETLK
ncbi:MAG TPA: cytochrome c [Bryobacteraceae bacterium]|nr:cytochrome c [Bryobacteraceae bacterium]